MDVREKLVDVFMHLDEHISYKEEYGVLFDTPFAEAVEKVLQMLKNCVTVQEWIPVTERLPEGDKVVLCYKADRGIRFGKLLDATYADGVQAFMDRDRNFAFGVTHWMPLPEPPKGD